MSILSRRYCYVDPLQGSKRGIRAGYSMYAFDLDRSRYISIYRAHVVDMSTHRVLGDQF